MIQDEQAIRFLETSDKRFKREESNKLDEVSLKVHHVKKQQRIVREIKKNLTMDSDDANPFQQEKDSIQISEGTLEGDRRTLLCLKQNDIENLSVEKFKEFEGTGEKEQQKYKGKTIHEFADLVSILTLRRDCARLKWLNTALCYFESSKSNFNSKIYLQSIENKLFSTIVKKSFQSLLFRVEFNTISGPWNEYGEEVFSADFKLCGPHVLPFCIFYDVPAWGSTSVSLRFHIPTFGLGVEYVYKHTETDDLSQALTCLSPITAEIQKCLDRDCQKVQSGVPYPEQLRYSAVPGQSKKNHGCVCCDILHILSGITALDLADQCMAQEFFTNTL